MKLKCPNCSVILNVAGCYIRTHTPVEGNSILSVSCHHCTTRFIPTEQHKCNDEILNDGSISHSEVPNVELIVS